MISLRELQLLAEHQYSVEQTREDLGRLTEFFRGQEYHKDWIETAFVKGRGLPEWLADQQKVFFVEESLETLDIPEEFRAESLGMVKGSHIVFSGRLVYPVLDVRGNVMGFCGWDKFAPPKYLDSKNHGYKAKATTVYGMEKLEEYYASDKPVYVVEGIVCCLYLRSLGLQALALLGSSITRYVAVILKRMESRLVIIPDNDTYGKGVAELCSETSGEMFVKKARKIFPTAVIIQSTIAKDVDDSRQTEYCDKFVEEIQEVKRNPFKRFSTIRVR